LGNEQHQPSEEDQRLCDEFMQKSFINERYVEILEQRQRLPAFEKRQEIIETVLRHQVVLIEGNTGCGKTTQVSIF
jgi:HrpA-like RNA helicase